MSALCESGDVSPHSKVFWTWSAAWFKMRGLDKAPMEAWVPHRDAIFYAAKPMKMVKVV
jgi:hypothetical protein